jgi:TolB-like protein
MWWLPCLLLGAPKEDVRVAILYFDNNTPDPDFDLLRKGMADMLITDLAGREGLVLLERSKLESVLSELELQRGRYFDPKTAQKVGKGMGATHAVTGAFVSVGDRLRIDVRSIEVSSGKVATTDMVIGRKADFFDLEQKLAASFACALAPKSCERVEPPKSEGAPSVTAIMRYASGLELFDSGNLEDASKVMREAMSEAPAFSAAKTRYLEIMKRLYAAKQVRTTELSGNEARLDAAIDRVLADDDLATVRTKDEIPERVKRLAGYRILRGQLDLHRIDRLFSDLADRKTTPSPADDRRFQELVKRYEENQLALIARVEAFEKNNGSIPEPALDEADAKAGVEIGLGDEPGNLDFMTPVMLRRDLGAFLATGREPFWGTFRWSVALAHFRTVRIDSGVRVRGQIEHRDVPRPPMDRLGDATRARGYGMLDSALTAAERLADPETKQTEIVRTLDAHGDALLENGSIELAIGKWQTILDRYPKLEDYAEIEGKIRSALGGTP